MLWNLLSDGYERYHLHHVLLLVLLIFYSIIGAVIFCTIEGQAEERDIYERHLRTLRARKHMLSSLHAIYNDGRNMTLPPDGRLLPIVNRYNHEVGVDLSREQKWTIWGGLYYAGTIYTTIGYGDLAAVTVAGRIFTVLYAIVGIPMVVTILNDWGTLMFNLVHSVWCTRIVPFYRRCIRKIHHQTRVKKKLHSKHGSTECMIENGDIKVVATHPEIYDDDYIDELPDADAPLPLGVVLVVFSSWMLLCTTLFSALEGWSLAESGYFFFVSLTTIGFGDVTPRHHIAVANFLFILIGLAVVSMTINVIQEHLERLFAEIVASIDSDFKTRMAESSDVMAISDENTNAGTLLNNIKGDADFIKGFEKGMHGADRLLMKFMSNHQKKMLNEKFDAKAKMRNRATQTNVQIRVASVQTGGQEPTPAYDTDESDDEPEIVTVVPGMPRRPPSRINPKKKSYIYNTGE